MHFRTQHMPAVDIKPPQLSIFGQVIIGILVGIVILIASFGNIAVIILLNVNGNRSAKLYSSVQNKAIHARHSVTSTFLSNLSAADLLHILLCAPCTLVADVFLIYWPFGEIMCRLVNYLQGAVVFLCAFTHIVISLDRLAAIQCPIWRRRHLSRASARMIIAGIWLCALTIPIPSLIVCRLVVSEDGVSYCQEVWPDVQAKYPILNQSTLNATVNDIFTSKLAEHYSAPWETTYNWTLMLLQYVIPLVVITGTYSAIVFRVWFRSSPGVNYLQREEKHCAAKKKLITMVITVALLYGISQLPRHLTYLVTMNSPNAFERETMMYAWLLCQLSTWSATCYNPIIYAWINHTFRRGFCDIAVKVCFCCRITLPGRRMIQYDKVECPETNVKNEPVNIYK